MRKAYDIEAMYASAWDAAIANVRNEINSVLWSADKKLDKELNWQDVEAICRVLGVRFDENGEIIRRVY